MYTYFCKIERVIDGDTVVATLDLGLHTRVTRTVRLYGVDAPELPTAEGKAAKAFLESILTGILVIKTRLDRDDKYGRLLGTFYSQTEAGQNLNKAMIAAGQAKEMTL